MPKVFSPPPLLTFLAIAITLMLLADHFIFGGERAYIEKIKQDYYAEQPLEQTPAEMQDQAETLAFMPLALDLPDEPEEAPAAVEPEPVAVPVVPDIPGGGGKIAIIIDDLGMDVKRSRQVVALPGPLTLAFLPYADKTPEIAAQGKGSGHELIIHTPMEPISASTDPGPMALRTGMERKAFTEEFQKIAASFDGYAGINNHMGSRLTQDRPAMMHLMEMLKDRHLFFVDSKTIDTSVAAAAAEESGVPYAVRDVFLDHEETAEFVAKALARTEHIARERGQAIAIGHPKDVTIEALRAWLPALKERGFELVPVSALIKAPAIVTPVSTTPSSETLLEQPEAAPLMPMPGPARPLE